MVAVADGTGIGPRQPSLPVGELGTADRLVAVALRSLDLLRPGSELARLLTGRESADLLLVQDERGAGGVATAGGDGLTGVLPGAVVDWDAGATEAVDWDAVDWEAPVREHGDDRNDARGERHDREDRDDRGSWDDEVSRDEGRDDEVAWDGDGWDDEGWDDEDWDDDEEPDDLGGALDGLGLGMLRVHRLGLRGPVGPAAEDDVVAALSELVGFDPEAGVYCVAPAPEPADPERAVVVAAAHRIARIYGLPLLRYRAVEPDPA